MFGKKKPLNEKIISVRPETYRRLKEIKVKSFDNTIRILLEQAKFEKKTVEILKIPEVE